MATVPCRAIAVASAANLSPSAPSPGRRGGTSRPLSSEGQDGLRHSAPQTKALIAFLIRQGLSRHILRPSVSVFHDPLTNHPG